jgi:hypothetical protein
VATFGGGGVRGIWTALQLALLEDRLRANLKAGEDFRLRDILDLVVGCSTGAIIAAAVAIGLSGHEIVDHYRRRMPDLFPRARISHLAQYQYGAQGAETVFRTIFGNQEIRDLGQPFLALCTFNQTTRTRAIYTNAPLRHRGDEYPDPENLAIWQGVYASCAAPTYFPPFRWYRQGREMPGGELLLVDGAMGLMSNPAEVSLQLATAETGLGWPTGQRELLLVSFCTLRQPKERLSPRANYIQAARTVPTWLIEGAEEAVHERVVQQHRNGAITYVPIDRRIGWRVRLDRVKAVPSLMKVPDAVNEQTVRTLASFAGRARR